MGIRLKTVLGYGLDLSKLESVNLSALDYDNLEDEALFTKTKIEALNFANEIKDLTDKFCFHPEDQAQDLANIVCFDPEMGFADKLVLVPSSYQKNWKRYGDYIDHALYEAEHDPSDKNWMEPEWIEKKGTLYPFIGLMKENSDKPLGVEKYWRPCYLDDPNYKNAIAFAPWHLWFVIKNMGLCPEEQVTKAFLSLRPVIYRYWS